MIDKETIQSAFKSIQDDIVRQLLEVDTKAELKEDLWKRDGGGGGRTRIIQKGKIIEKGGVNFSAVHGDLPAPLCKEFKIESGQFFATGVSIVIHPHNPHVPIIHMNIRYFELSDGTYWFGGGIDLTPHYVVKEDAGFFHEALQRVCDRHHPEFYNEFKKWADQYFYIPHRQETRGVGGIFFDKLKENEHLTKKQCFDFVCDVGNTFAPVYTTLMQKHGDVSYTEEEKQWQLLRRGRYVEFNLVYDRGTKFGLQTNGRIESILMSLPKTAGWEYDFTPEEGSKEAATLKLLRKGVNWVGEI